MVKFGRKVTRNSMKKLSNKVLIGSICLPLQFDHFICNIFMHPQPGNQVQNGYSLKLIIRNKEMLRKVRAEMLVLLLQYGNLINESQLLSWHT